MQSQGIASNQQMVGATFYYEQDCGMIRFTGVVCGKIFFPVQDNTRFYNASHAETVELEIPDSLVDILKEIEKTDCDSRRKTDLKTQAIAQLNKVYYARNTKN